MNDMRKQLGSVLLVGERCPRGAPNPYWHLCQLSLTAWATHLAEVSRSPRPARIFPDGINAFMQGPEVRRPRRIGQT